MGRVPALTAGGFSRTLDHARRLKKEGGPGGWTDDLAVKIDRLHERLTLCDDTGESRISRALHKRPDWEFITNEQYAEECDRIILGSSKWINRHSNGIPFDKLRDIKLLFESRQTHDQSGFTEDDFVEVFAPVFCPSQDPNQVKVWFMGIDQDANGYIDWDEFSAYLMKTQHAVGDNEGKSVVYISRPVEPETPPGAQLPINKIVYNPTLKVYYTAAADGTVRMWDGHSLEERGTVHYGEGSMVHSLHYDHDTKRLIVSQFDRLTFIYSCTAQRPGGNGGHKLQRVFKGEKVNKGNENRVNKITKLCEYEPDSMIMENSSTQFFTQALRGVDPSARNAKKQGGNVGRVGRFRIDVVLMDELNQNSQCMVPMHSVFQDKVDPFIYGTEDGRVYLFNLALRDESNEPGQSSHITVQHLEPGQHVKKLHCWHSHTDWVTHLQAAPALQGFISSSLDGSIQVQDVHKQKSYLRMDAESDPVGSQMGSVGRGVHCFDYGPERNLLCSCGISREAIVWNPKARQRMCTLSEHRAALIDVKFVEKHSQLITMSEDKIIKVWDTRMFRCIQTLTDKERRYPEDKYAGLGYDFHNDAILCGAGVPVVWRDGEVQAKMETGLSWHAEYEGHLTPIITCVYNSRFQHLLSVDERTLQIWDLKTGRLISKWSPSWQDGKGDGRRLTAVCFDSGQRRLLTGTDNGSVDMWSLDGRRLKSFEGMNVEISSVLHIVAHEGQSHAQAYVVAGGFGSRCAVWQDTPILAGHRVSVQDQAHMLGTHNSQVYCLAFSPPNKLAIGTADGSILLYNMNNMSLMSENRSVIGSRLQLRSKKAGSDDEAHSPTATSPTAMAASRTPPNSPGGRRSVPCSPVAAVKGEKFCPDDASDSATATLGGRQQTGTGTAPTALGHSPSFIARHSRRMDNVRKLLKARDLEAKLEGAQEFTSFRSTTQLSQLVVAEAIVFLPHPSDPARVSDAIVTLHGDGDALVWRLKDGYFLEIAACFPASFSAGEAAYALTVDREKCHVYCGDVGGIVSVFDLLPYTTELERTANLAKAQNAVTLAQRMVSLQTKKVAATRKRGSVHRSSVLPPEDSKEVAFFAGTPGGLGKRKGKQKGRTTRKVDRLAESCVRGPAESRAEPSPPAGVPAEAKRGPSGRIYHNRCGVKLVKCFDTGCGGAITQVALVSGSPLLVVASNDCALTLINTETASVLSRMGYVGEFPGSWPSNVFTDPDIPLQPMNVPRPTRQRTVPRHRFSYVFPDFVQSGEVEDSLIALEQTHAEALQEAVSAAVSDLTPRSRRRGTARRLAQKKAAAAVGLSLPALNQRPSSAVPHPDPESATDEALQTHPQQRRSQSAIPPGTQDLSPAGAPRHRPSTAMAVETGQDPEGEDEETKKEEETRANQKRLQRYLHRTRHRRRKRYSPRIGGLSPGTVASFCTSELTSGICTPEHAPSAPLEMDSETEEEAEVGFAGDGVLQKIQKANEQVTQLLKNMQKRRGPTRKVPNLQDHKLGEVADDLNFPRGRTYQDICRWVPPGHQQPERPCRHCRRHKNTMSPHVDERLPEFERALSKLWTRPAG
eukprot:Hpha_TRINITY_DN10692_c0_g1::TRINITY_DN10692_c0_g1_i1::g.156834::m.156834